MAPTGISGAGKEDGRGARSRHGCAGQGLWKAGVEGKGLPLVPRSLPTAMGRSHSSAWVRGIRLLERCRGSWGNGPSEVTFQMGSQ